MQRALYVLRLLLPDRPTVGYRVTSNGPGLLYMWPCGCHGTGDDDIALDVVSCKGHHDLLNMAAYHSEASPRYMVGRRSWHPMNDCDSGL